MLKNLLSAFFALFISISGYTLGSATLYITFIPALGPNRCIATSTVQIDKKIILEGNLPSYSGISISHFARLYEDGLDDETYIPSKQLTTYCAGTSTDNSLDRSGNTTKCVQNITGPSSPVSLATISFPPNITVSNCTGIDTSKTGGVKISADMSLCSKVSITFSDNTPPQNPLCSQTIIRNWVVVDTCQLVPGTNNGRFSFAQTITVIPQQPLINGPSTISLTADPTTCSAEIAGLFNTATGCNLTLKNSQNDSPSFNLSGVYPVGQTWITLTATDICGRISTFNIIVDVKDVAADVTDIAALKITCRKVFPQITDQLFVDEPASSYYSVERSCNDKRIVLASFDESDPSIGTRRFNCDDVGVFPTPTVNLYFYFQGQANHFFSCSALSHAQDPNNFCNECNPVTITTQPQNKTVQIGSTPNFSVVATGTGPFTYQWRKNGVNISGANNQTYETPILKSQDDGSEYSCIVTNCGGIYADTSNVAAVNVINQVSIIYPNIILSSGSITAGQNVNITGSKFTPNEKAKLTVTSQAGFTQTINNISINNLGGFTYSFVTNTSMQIGKYTIWAKDVKSDKITSQSFVINPTPNFSEKNLQILGLKDNFTANLNETILVEFKDKMIKGPNYTMVGAKRNFKYFLEISNNGGMTWTSINAIEGSEYLEKYVLLKFFPKLNTIGNNFRLRVRDAFDSNNFDLTGIIDVPNVVSGISEVEFKWDHSYPLILSKPQQPVIGVAADGTARIFLDLHKKNLNSGPQIINVSVSLEDLLNNNDPKKLGRVKTANQVNNYNLEANGINTISANDNTPNKNNYLFWYVAPDDFAGNDPSDITSSFRIVNAKFTVNYSDGSIETLIKKINIVRPPLMLVHGLGGDPDTWKSFSNSGSLFLSDYRFKVVEAIKIDPKATFLNNAYELLTSHSGSIIKTSFSGVISKMRDAGYAANRVDCVTHSMGGNVVRTALTLNNLYFRTGNHANKPYKNYEKGYVNKFITIGTPHNGSPWADMLKRYADDLSFLLRSALANNNIVELIAPNNKYSKIFRSLVDENRNTIPFKYSITDAVSNLQIDESKGGIDLPSTNLHSHLIASDIWPGTSYSTTNVIPQEIIDIVVQSREMADLLNHIVKIDLLRQPVKDVRSLIEIELKGEINPVKRAFKMLEIYFDAINVSFFIPESDLIVSVESQLASYPKAITQPNVTIIEDLSAHAFLSNSETQNLKIGDKVMELLNTPIGSDKFNIIPATNNLVNNDEIINRANLINQDSITNTKFDFIFDKDKFEILEPSPQSNLFVGTNTNVKINLKDTVNLLVLEMHFQGETQVLKNKTVNPNILGIFESPLEINSGYLDNQRLVLEGIYMFGDSILTVYDTVTVKVVPDEILIEFRVDPEIKFLKIGESFKPEHFAIFQTYTSSSQQFSEDIIYTINNPELVSFDSIGKIFTGKNIGETFCTIEYKGLKDTMYLIIDGCNDLIEEFSISELDSITLCGNESLTLNAPEASSYIWSNGETTKSINVDSTGSYFVIITDENGCTAASFITEVFVHPLPTIQSSNITFSSVSSNQMTLNWTNGNGTNRIVVAKANSPIIGLPKDSTFYVANSNFGGGSTIANGEFVVYNGKGTNVTVSNLTEEVIYHYRIYEYGCDNPNFLTATANGNPNSQKTTSCGDGIKNGNETGIDCGGACPPCTTCMNISVEIRTDQFPQEISWNIKNSAGTIFAIGGNYSSYHTLIKNTFCLQQGCYAFNITDVYGDGILSPGYYKVLQGTTELVSYIPFGKSKTVNFCLGTTPPPTCTDGIKNGNETGIDCGGNCSPCPSCSDGIKNGNETGIDCGGACPKCPTCNDGIKNGNETGIDCGGNCSPCPTCSDGIKNGNETGIDCGGSCSPCPTCSDGIKNGNETGVDCGGTCVACPTCNDGIKNGNETGIDCGGACPPCATCMNISVEIRTDQFPQEISWNIKNSVGTIVASGGNYSSYHTLIKNTYCLQEGCYTFNIADVYGDGILSPGYFKVLQGTTELVSYSPFGKSKTANFCLGSSTYLSCNDGIKNGNETDVDCGGSCPPCESCTNIAVEIRTDQFPGDLSWNIKNSVGTIVANRNNYNTNHTIYKNDYCLPKGCYTFNINDSFGDGILSPGYFKVLQGNTEVVSNSTFTSAKSVSFCLSSNIVSNGVNLNKGIINGQLQGNLTHNAIADDEFSIKPNPTEQMIQIRINTQITKIKVLNLAGQIMILPPVNENSDLDVSGLNNGMYIIQVETERGMYARKFIKR